MKLFISPHNDDEALFGAFTIMKESPHVAIVFDSYVQVQRGNTGADWQTRRNETLAAMMELGIKGKISFLALRDDAPDWGQLRTWLKAGIAQQFNEIICPAFETAGHDQHNSVAAAVQIVTAPLDVDVTVTRYLTYTRTGGRSRSAHEVIPTPDMIARKHRALACYKSQMEVPDCRPWFMGPINEFLALPPAETGAKP